MTADTSSSFRNASIGFSCQPRTSQEMLLQMNAVKPPRMAPSISDFVIEPPERTVCEGRRDARFSLETHDFANYFEAGSACCEMPKMLPSGSFIQATWSPPGAVQMPSSLS